MEIIKIKPEIYTFDIDSGRHVSNISYIKWMEIGRIKLLEKVGMAVHEIEKAGFFPVLTHTDISYKKPLYLGDEIRVELFLSKLRKISGRIQFNFIKDTDELVAVGTQDAVFLSLDTKRVYKLSDVQLRKLSKHLIEK